MEHAKRPPLTLVLRRFSNESVELLPANVQMAVIHDQEVVACRVLASEEGDTQVYEVLLPESFIVRPVDWRRFSYSHEKVADLVSLCVRDNLERAPLIFEVWSDELRKLAETTLTLALGDLSSIIDIKSVRCDNPNGSEILTTIEGEHKNGNPVCYRIAFEMLR